MILPEIQILWKAPDCSSCTSIWHSCARFSRFCSRSSSKKQSKGACQGSLPRVRHTDISPSGQLLFKVLFLRELAVLNSLMGVRKKSKDRRGAEKTGR
ncbi:hypothetical protein K443DRAFT_352125 [Laccaria amethystina LaAM-08-1]|jgi:hypothetical protein|uniref:Uncharacterized protein n=1 Tax=Laccaria amethystina LaAM-08-1 TaxID=1095629 RepID=A0A0C9XUT3_9AGAR|nr:hypothetical protein K443DRAFT_352125 [Laccaria amethystina LaAM-08-1]